jgi:hypothetical protein
MAHEREHTIMFVYPLIYNESTIHKEQFQDFMWVIFLICVHWRTVSGLHARLERKAGTLFVTDLGSTNGTYINDKPIRAGGTGTPVPPGSRITFGLYLGTHSSLFLVPICFNRLHFKGFLLLAQLIFHSWFCGRYGSLCLFCQWKYTTRTLINTKHLTSEDIHLNR